nr:galanin receptor type 2-like [Penaeus vannamei]
MLIVVVVLFLLCWGPKLVMQMCITLGLRQFNQVFYNFNIVFVLLPFIHCCINPIIYCFMSKNFRRSMKRMFGSPWRSCRRRGCCPTRRPPPANLLNRVVTRSIYSSYSPEGTSRHTDLETVSTIQSILPTKMSLETDRLTTLFSIGGSANCCGQNGCQRLASGAGKSYILRA